MSALENATFEQEKTVKLCEKFGGEAAACAEIVQEMDETISQLKEEAEELREEIRDLKQQVTSLEEQLFEAQQGEDL